MSTTTESSTSTAPGRTPGGAGLPGGFTAAVGGPVALAAANACFARLTADGQAAGAADHLDLVDAHPVLVEAGCALALLASLLLVPAVWAVVGRLSDRRARLATAGGWLMASGYVMAVALSVESLLALAVTRASGSPESYISAVDHHTSATATAVYVVFGLGALVGGMLLGVAMLRHPDVPRWAGLAVVASEPVRVVGLLTGVDILTAAASLLLLGLARALRTGRRH